MIDSITGFLIAGLLLLFGARLFNQQKNNLTELTERDDKKDASPLRAFLIRQARRRMHTGALFFLTGVAFFAGLQINLAAHPNLSVGVWFASVFFLVWAILLAIIDIFEIRFRYNEEKSVREAAMKGLEYLRHREQERFSKESAAEDAAAEKKR